MLWNRVALCYVQGNRNALSLSTPDSGGGRVGGGGLCLTLVVVKLLLFLIHMYLTLGGLWTQIARAIE